MATEFNYNNFVVVAHDEWKLECLYGHTTKISEYFGGFEWRITFSQQRSLTLECVELKEGTHSGDVHMELFVYGRRDSAGNYESWNKLGTMPQMITFSKNVSSWSLPSHEHYTTNSCKSGACPDCKQFVALNVRILKHRAFFHDFTVDLPIGHLKSDLKLKVGEQIFHVNKKTLEVLSIYFHRMFNNPNFVEAKQDTIGTGETDVALFHDFLLLIHSTSKCSVHPNSQNLAGLLRLAEYYGVDSLFEKFDRCLKLCREMPINERIMLAKKYGPNEFNVAGILQDVNDVKQFRHLYLALFHAKD